MRRIHRLAASQRGNVSVFFALSAVPLLLAAGAAIDFSHGVLVRSKTQSALDAAVLASAAREEGLGTSDARKYFGVNSDLADVTISNFDVSKDADGNTLGTVTVSFPTGIMGIAGMDSMSVTLNSEAKATFPKKVDTETFQITNAQGAYDKDIYVFTKDKDGNILNETLVLQYDYSYSKGVGTKKYIPAMTSSITATIGPYETFGQKMVVYEDTSYTGKHINPKSYYSDDPSASNWTKTTGDCVDGQTQNWEDGGDSNYLDFVFTVTCTETTSGSVHVQLIK